MQRLPVIVGLATICLAMLVGIGATEDAKKDKDEKKETAKFKPYTPPGFKALMLTKEQKDKIYSIQSEYHTKITELQNKITELKDRRSEAEFKVLTAEQREKYLKSKGVDVKGKDGDKEKK